MGNIALTILSIITARPEGEEEGGAQCDIKYLIPNTTLTNFESQKRGRGDDSKTGGAGGRRVTNVISNT